MTPETFLEEFSTVANAPGGVQRLREMILQLAVQGKLVPQNPEDEPASNFFEKIVPKTNGRLKEKDKHDLVKMEEEYLNLPVNWVWVRLKWVGNLFNGNSINEKIKEEKYTGKKAIEGLPFIATKDVGYGFISLNYENDVRIPINEPRFKIAHKNSVLICAEGGSAGKKCGIANQDICFGNKLFAFESYGAVHQNFLLGLYLSPVFFKQFQGRMTGIIGGISLANFANIPIPLPPLEEQLRIVAKVDQLMALCDRLEAQQKKRTKLVGHTRKTVLEALTHSQGREELCAAWQRVEENFGMLFETPEDVEDLKKSILQNAVMGKLVEQNLEDEPASELLKKIAAEKAELVKKGEIKKAKPLPKIRDDEKPFEIPKAWEWVRLGYLMPDYQNGISKRGSTVGMDTVVLRLADVTDNKISIANTRSIQLTEKERSQYLLDDGDILITRVNGSINLVGSFICVRERKYPIAYCDHFIRMRLIKHLIDIDYIHMVSRSILVRRQIAGKFITTAGQKTVNQNHITTLLFPLPPLAEQHRIVAKVQSLLALCDGLQSRIAEFRTIAGQLAQSIVESITGITTEKQEKMKIPKTELVSRLVLAKKPGAREHAPLSELMARHNNELSAKALWNHSGLPIGEFYRQLKIEMINGWIKEPAKAQVRVVED